MLRVSKVILRVEIVKALAREKNVENDAVKFSVRMRVIRKTNDLI